MIRIVHIRIPFSFRDVNKPYGVVKKIIQILIQERPHEYNFK